MPPLTDRTVVITGASSGIGAAVAVESARSGANVALLARRMGRLTRVEQEVRSLARTALSIRCDVTAEADLQRAIALVRDEFGRIDFVVANAGFQVRGRFEELTLDDFRRQFETNVFGVLRTVYATLDDLKQSRGSLVLIGSMLGHVALPGTSAYAMSKFAVTALAAAVRFELAESQVSVLLVSPGNVATEIRRIDNQDVLQELILDPKPSWLTMTADRAARQIVRAMARRRPRCTLTGLARLAMATERLAPGVLARALRFNRMRQQRRPANRRSGDAASSET